MAEKDVRTTVKQEDQKKFDLDAHLAKAKEKSLEWRNKIAEICKNDSHLNIILLGSLAREEVTENSDLEILFVRDGINSTNNKRKHSSVEDIKEVDRRPKRRKVETSGGDQTNHCSSTMPENNSPLCHAKQTVASILDQLKNSSGFWKIVDKKLEVLSSQAYSFDEVIKQYKEIFKVKKQSINHHGQSEYLSRIGGLFDCYSLSTAIPTKHFAKQVLEKIDEEQYYQFAKQDLTDYTISGNIDNCPAIWNYAKKLAENDGKIENEEYYEKAKKKSLYHFVTLLIRDLYCYYKFSTETDNEEYANTTSDRIKRCSQLLGRYYKMWTDMFTVALQLRGGNEVISDDDIWKVYTKCVSSINTIIDDCNRRKTNTSN